jgi:hypothetical protein
MPESNLVELHGTMDLCWTNWKSIFNYSRFQVGWTGGEEFFKVLNAITTHLNGGTRCSLHKRSLNIT